MKRVMVLGGAGNMGRRYCAVLRHLGITPVPIDVVDGSIKDLKRAVTSVQGVIIATPTASHAADIEILSSTKIPILCEKPISMSMPVVEECIDRCRSLATPLAMVNQYLMLTNQSDRGDSAYDNWNHGRDGLAWDCISIIALAKGKITLSETSPIWKCRINGRNLDLSDIDHAYIAMVDEWQRNPTSNPSYIRNAHSKVHDYVRTHEQSDR